jgi:hypothetical protein
METQELTEAGISARSVAQTPTGRGPLAAHLHACGDMCMEGAVAPCMNCGRWTAIHCLMLLHRTWRQHLRTKRASLPRISRTVGWLLAFAPPQRSESIAVRAGYPIGTSSALNRYFLAPMLCATLIKSNPAGLPPYPPMSCDQCCRPSERARSPAIPDMVLWRMHRRHVD